MESFILDLSVVLVVAAVLAFLAVILKQPIIIAYILCGVVIGPWGVGWIKNAEFIEAISHIGITLLLFLAGLCLHPQKLIELFRKTAIVTLANSVISFLIAFGFARLCGFTPIDALCIGLALMFSSTILVVKLLPTTTLHQQRMGGLCIGVLIMQDLIAVVVLVFLRSLGAPEGALMNFGIVIVKLCVFIALLVAFEHFVLHKIMLKIDRIQEALFIVSLALCFGIASISYRMGLFYETGAFFAGVVIARHPISLFMSERLKPIRDFFLVLFFFTLGANIDLFVAKGILWQAALLAGIFCFVKPVVFRKFFILTGEQPAFSKEIGMRLGQLSEFSLLIAILAFDLEHISVGAAQLIQLVAILSFVISGYVVVMHLPTPIAPTERLRKD